MQETYCLCCGYELHSTPRSYGICEICYWEDDPIQAEEPFYSGGANTIPLIVAKFNYEKDGVSEARFREKVVVARGQTRDPDYKSSNEILRGNLEKLESEISSSIKSGEYDLFHFYVDTHYEGHLEFSKKISEKLLRDENYRFVWVKLARRYFGTFERSETREIWDHLESVHHNSWEELQEILREFA